MSYNVLIFFKYLPSFQECLLSSLFRWYWFDSCLLSSAVLWWVYLILSLRIIWYTYISIHIIALNNEKSRSLYQSCHQKAVKNLMCVCFRIEIASRQTRGSGEARPDRSPWKILLVWTGVVGVRLSAMS